MNTVPQISHNVWTQTDYVVQLFGASSVAELLKSTPSAEAATEEQMKDDIFFLWAKTIRV